MAGEVCEGVVGPVVVPLLVGTEGCAGVALYFGPFRMPEVFAGVFGGFPVPLLADAA